MTWQRIMASMTAALAVLMLVSFAGEVSAQSKLKPCPKSQSARYHNCYGTYKWDSGNKYVGEWKNHKVHGQGTFTFANGNIYVGEFKDGKRNGQGTYTYASGDKYVGEYKDNKRFGQGTYTYASGDKYVGEFKDGTRNGQGTFTFANGNKYVGQFRDGKRNGQGTFTWRNGPNKGNKYVGEYKDGKRNGQGTFTFASGSIYVGEFKDNKRNGQGTYTHANGDKYVGEYKDSKRHGQGTYTSANGNKYVGQFRDGKRNGQGTSTWADGPNKGNKYVGEYKDNKRIGQGTYTYASGGKYVGEFKDDLFHGRGVRYAADGSIIEQGIFEKDKLVKAETVVEQPQVAAVQPQQQTPPQQSVAVQTNERKVALVIGNGAYQNENPLANPKNDASAMSAMLKSMGFDVVSGVDLSFAEMGAKVREFVKAARQADLSLFFYAGHGIQVAGQNYLIPVDAGVEDATALDFELVNVSSITSHMGGMDKVGIVLLDACRNNPFTRSLMRSLGNRASQVSNGLAPIASPAGGLLVGFATAPGDVAADGDGKNSPFTTALLKHMPTPGLEIEHMMKQVKAEVIQLTRNEQRPWHNSDIARYVYLTNKQ